MRSASSADARRAAERVFGRLGGVDMRRLRHAHDTDAEHTFEFVAALPAGGTTADLCGRHAVADGPVDWVELDVRSVGGDTVVGTARCRHR